VQKWSVNLQTLSNKKIHIKGDLIVDGNIISQGSAWEQVKSKDFSLCANPDPTGPCIAHLSLGRTFLEAAKFCAAMGADICTDSQSFAARKQWSSLIGLAPNWTNSFADNDSQYWSDANGGTGDNHNAATSYLTACCFNVTPTQPGEQKSGGVRVLKVNNTANATFADAVSACLAVQGDLCDKGQYYAIRAAGLISAPMWASDHSDNDGGVCNSSIGSTSDETAPDQKYGYACCATGRTTLSCPSPNTVVNGVCVVKVYNSDSYAFTTAASNCANLGARICSIAQSAVLRAAGTLSSGSTWTASHSDSDGQQALVGVGNAGDNPSDGSGYGYACCM
jgi:hypothetical protein